MPKRTPESIFEDQNLQLLLVLDHQDMLPFLEKYLLGMGPIMRWFWRGLCVLLLVLVGVAVVDLLQGNIGLGTLSGYLMLGLAATFTAGVVVHEGLHGLAYKLIGAPRVSYGVNWKWLYFYAVADRFVVSGSRFFFVALAPFVVITLFVAIMLAVNTSIETKWFLFGILLFHTAACSGDFAILDFCVRYSSRGTILTFDDVSEGKSYFFLQPR